jgi:hypothetical protein
MRAIASSSVFPTHTLPNELQKRAAQDFGIEAHIRTMRKIFAAVAA